MPHRILSAGKLTRSLFFIGFVGGLLFFLSYTFTYVANNYLYNTFELEKPVTLLETAGVVAFIYVVAFGLKFGFSKSPKYDKVPYTQIDLGDNSKGKASENCDDLQQKLRSEKLTRSEKSALKRRLEEICGIEARE